MRRRIFGLETEYGITFVSAPGGLLELDAEAAARELFAPVMKQHRSTNVFLPNGGRLYLDVGAHPEYASAECDSLWDLLAQVRGGATMLANMASQANRQFAGQGRLHLFGNNSDSQGSSYGCHENYLLRRSRDFRDVADALVSFFVTRQIICGAGDIHIREDGSSAYAISARADRMQDSVSAATTRSRPIINTRDEPLGDASSYRRLHVIVGDSNMAEPTTALKVASTDMVLSAIEEGTDFQDLALADPMRAIRAVSLDLHGEQVLELRDGRKWRAAEIQTEIMERTLRRVEAESTSELYQYLIALWSRAIRAYATHDWNLIDREIDYAVKAKLIERYQERTGADLDDPRVTRLILAYHDITDAGMVPAMEETGLLQRLTTVEQVHSALSNPPPTTRAALRGAAISAATNAGRSLGVDWVNMRLDGSGSTISLQDPFGVHDERVESLVRELEQIREKST